MKKSFYILAACICSLSTNAQSSKSIFKVVPIITKQTYFLNGGARAAFGGMSRQNLQVDLPPNTVEWYYAVSTTPNQSQTADIGLSGQLVKLLVPGLGISSNLLSSLIAPTGSGVCDVFLLVSPTDALHFFSKQPNFTFVFDDTRQNFKSGVVQIKDFLNGRCFLGIRNPSAMQGINITIEVTAIVKEPAEVGNTAMK